MLLQFIISITFSVFQFRHFHFLILEFLLKRIFFKQPVQMKENKSWIFTVELTFVRLQSIHRKCILFRIMSVMHVLHYSYKQYYFLIDSQNNIKPMCVFPSSPQFITIFYSSKFKLFQNFSERLFIVLFFIPKTYVY